MKTTLAVIMGICLVVSAVLVVVNAIKAERDFENLKDRAQVAATTENVIYWLDKLNENLDKNGYYEGYTSIWVKSPWKDMAEIRRNLDNIRDRAELLNTLPKTSDAYNQGLDDVRGSLRELELQAYGYWLASRSGWIFACLLLPLSIVGLIILGLGSL